MELRHLLLILLCVPILSAACNPGQPVCAYTNTTIHNAVSMPNESYALGLGFTIAHCGNCYCKDQTVAVCGANGITYPNETASTASGTIAIHCGACSGLSTAYYNCAANYTQYGNFSNQSGSLIERYLTCGFRAAIGGGKIAGVDAASTAEVFMAILIVGFFLAFVMMQNTRFDAKVAIMIPVIIMAAIWATTGWLMTLLVFGIGILLYLAFGKMINK